jgi:hypothetical protein
MEGTLCPSGDPRCTNGVFTRPILEYDHSLGCSITGGLRVRGPNLPSFAAKYLYADYCSGLMWAGTQVSGSAWTSAVVWDFGTNISSFGEDENGDVYVAAHATGTIYRLTEELPVLTVANAAVTEGNSGTRAAAFPATLSKASNQTVSVTYATMPGSAGPSDFALTSGTLTFPPGTTTASITIPVFGDTLDEPNEAFLLSLGAPTGATLARSMAQGTILDDDGRPALYLPIATVPFTITAQGNYRLTRNVSTAQATGAAITISSDFVTLDLGSLKLGGGAAGPGTSAIGVYALDRRNVTVRNGNVRGFLRGVFLEGAGSRNHLVERIRADENTLAGIDVTGPGSVVRRNQVVSTGGTTSSGADVDTFGIRVDGARTRILDNDVTDTTPVGSGTGHAIFAANATSAVIDKNRAANSAAVTSAGIFAASGSNVLVLGNRLTGLTSGVVFDAATGKYAGNLTSGVTTPYAGGVDAGGNQ